MTVGVQRRHILLAGSLGLGLATVLDAPAIAVPPPLIASGGGQFTEIEPREDVASVVLQDFAGRRRTLASCRGRPALLAFWASWCPPCLRELPILHRLQRGRDLGFAVVPVSLDRDTATASRFINLLGLRGFDSFIDTDGTVASGPKSVTQTAFQLYGMPMSYIIDAEGRTAGYLTGAADWSMPDAIRLMQHYGR